MQVNGLGAPGCVHPLFGELVLMKIKWQTWNVG